MLESYLYRMLQLTNVKKFYHTHLVLQIPFLQLKSGIYWVKGANGCGKTTLLKMVAGLLPFEGDISFKDISLKRSPLLYRQQVSWAEAEPLFPTFLTGTDLISLYRGVRKVPQHTVHTLTELFNMTGYVNGAIGTYSSGMVKKLSLLLAFLGDTPLVVLDEPLITLDPDAFTFLCTFILEKYKANGTTFLMSSHQELDTSLAIAGKELTVINGSILSE